MIVWMENPEVWRAAKERSHSILTFFFPLSAGTDCVTVMQIQRTSEELFGNFHRCN